jgi:hypothetical protein
MTCIDYKDTITLVTTTVDSYGAEVVDSEYEVNAIVEMATGYTHSDYQDAITSDAIAFLDPTNSDVIANFYRLEEMLVIANLFGASEAQSWFKIENVVVARDTLLCNTINNVQVNLKKVRPVGGIS